MYNKKVKKTFAIFTFSWPCLFIVIILFLLIDLSIDVIVTFCGKEEMKVTRTYKSSQHVHKM